MEELKDVIARNLVVYRKNAGLTQQEIADKINYSDKAVSKWERYRDNCKDVSLTACYAHLGYGDLKANAKSFKGNLTDFMEDRFENAEVNHLTADSSNVQERLNRQILKKCSEGDTGIVGISYDPKFLKANAAEDGHAFNFFVEDGRVLFKDAQPEQPLEDASKWFKALDAGKEVEWVKIDETLIPKADALEKSMSKL